MRDADDVSFTLAFFLLRKLESSRKLFKTLPKVMKLRFILYVIQIYQKNRKNDDFVSLVLNSVSTL